MAEHHSHDLAEILLQAASEYPLNPRQRPFHETYAANKIIAMIQEQRPRFLALCRAIARNREWYQKIPYYNKGPTDPTPSWINGYLPGLDAMLLYSLIVLRNPKVYLEVGSGNSTRFVRCAIADHNLSTRIISIDPQPRTDIEQICDQIIRKPLEEMVHYNSFSGLSREDVVFIDSSHRSFQNYDVTVFFTEILPLIPSGVIYGVHDILLPFDYSDEWADRFYNEQYLLVCYLLGGASGDRIAFPGTFVSLDTEARGILEFLHYNDYFRVIEKHAGAFWLERA